MDALETKTRVLIFSTAYLPFIGGAEIAVKEITDRTTGIDFEMITARFDSSLPREEQVGNVYVHRVGPGIPTIDKILLLTVGWLRVRSIVREKNVSAFWSVMVTWASWSAYLYNIIFFHVPHILTLQEGDSEEYIEKARGGFIRRSWHFALSHSSAVTAISSYLISRARDFGYKGRTYLVPNGVDVEKFEGVDRKRAEDLRDKFISSQDDVLLITTSRLVEKNAVGDIICALEYLPDHVKLMVVGDGEERSRLVSLAQESFAGRVHFVGSVEHREIPVYLHAADIFVRPSLSEGMGNSFIEAMAAGLPVVATPVGGIVDFIEEKKTGFFAEVKDFESIAREVEYILDHPQEVEEVVMRAKEVIRDRYQWDAVAHKMRAVIDNVVEQ